MSQVVKLCIVGALGRMGRQILDAAVNDTDATVNCGVVLPGDEADTVCGETKLYSGVPKEAFDVVVDFSSPAGVALALEVARSQRVPLVVGTTGFDTRVREELTRYSKDCVVVVTSNFSVGMNMMFWLARQLGERLGSDFEPEVFEIHHRFKKDAPSGSALTIASEIARARGVNPDSAVIKGRAGMSEGRDSSQVGVAALRGGDVPGEHTMFFFGEGERLEITHRVSNRSIFARGALRAAKWSVSQPPGYYSMLDVLGLS